MAIELVRGDITKVEADAIANAANSALAGGGGVDGAIHRAGGPTIMEELRKYKGCPTGSAVATGAGRLKATWVFHAVGPIYRGSRNDAELLASAYRACMALAREKGCRSIAFPSISTGVYGYPVEEAAPIAVRTVRESMGEMRVMFVLFDEKTYEAFKGALGSGEARC